MSSDVSLLLRGVDEQLQQGLAIRQGFALARRHLLGLDHDLDELGLAGVGCRRTIYLHDSSDRVRRCGLVPEIYEQDDRCGQKCEFPGKVDELL